MGTPEFSVPSLKKLIECYNVKAVVTQPDRQKGRGKKVCFSPVKEIALQNNIEVYQPERIRKDAELIGKIRGMKPDFIIVVAFGQILSKEILQIPKYACINLHASLLPKYRGAAPINWSIINGETKTGNTTMLMDAGIDTGDMLQKSTVKITEDMTYGELHDKLMEDGAELLADTIDKYTKGQIVPQKQPDSELFYAKILTKDMAQIDWKKTSREIADLIRGLYPMLTAYTTIEDTVMKVHKAKILQDKAAGEPGFIQKVDESGIKVTTGDGSVLIEKIQFPGKKPMTVREYIRGNTIKEGLILK